MPSADTAVRTPPTPFVASRHSVGPHQLGSELRLIFGRRRNLAMLVLLAAIPVFIGIAVKVSTPRPG
ncbi:MAG: ABC transporter permease, partial [Actinomycetota bacterium]|nr:ABC transporter permease [Actinomycetota bacterium]